MKIRSIIDDKKKQRVRDAIARGDNSVFRTKKKEDATKPEPMRTLGFEEAQTLTSKSSSIWPTPAPPPVQQPAPQPPVQQPAPPPHPLFLGNPWINQPPPVAPQPVQPAQKAPTQTLNAKLFEAITNNDISGVQKALTSGADVDARNYGGDTPLMVASQKGFHNIAAVLIQEKARINDTNPSSGHTALMYAAMNGHERVVQELMRQNAAAGARDNKRMTAFFHAASQGKFWVVQELARHSDVDAWSSEGLTPLMHAAKYNDQTTARVLIDREAKVDFLNEKGQTPLSLAVEYGSLEAAELLLERGALKGLTVLEHAELMKKAKNSDMKKLLKKHMK